MVLLIVVSLPGNALIFVTKLMSIVTFNLIDCTSLFYRIFRFDDVDPLNTRYDLFGYSSYYFVLNFGTPTILIVLLPALWVISWFIYILVRGCKNYKIAIHKKFTN